MRERGRSLGRRRGVDARVGRMSLVAGDCCYLKSRSGHVRASWMMMRMLLDQNSAHSVHGSTGSAPVVKIVLGHHEDAIQG